MHTYILLIWNFWILLRKYFRCIVCEEVVLVDKVWDAGHEGLILLVDFNVCMYEYMYVCTVGVASSNSKSNGEFSITVVNITFPPSE